MSDKNYISSFIKERKGKYGKFMTVSMKLADLQALPVDDYGHVKVTINERRELDKFGNTHYMTEDTFKPDNRTSGQATGQANELPPSAKPDDLPF